MKIQSSYLGADRPFERDQRLDLRCIPQGASIRSAVATVTPVSTDADGQFLETITLNSSGNSSGNGAGNWGASKRHGGNPARATSLEIDLRARRRLAEADGSNLASASLLVDLGGGFAAVDADGGLGADHPPFELRDGSNNLPGLTVTGLRVQSSTAQPDITVLRVQSPPTNVTMALAGGPTFWTHFGDLVDPVSTPDFAALLQEAVDQAPVEHGSVVLGFDVHSDSISRLDITLDVDYLVTESATPEGVGPISMQYRFGSTPEGGGSPLTVSMPTGTVAAPQATTGRVQGSFEASRIVFGPTGSIVATDRASVEPSASHAQPFTLAETTLASSVDVLLAAVTASTEAAIDIVGDLDGKPDRVSLLSLPPTRRITRDDAPDLTWINIALPAELELQAGRRYWLVVHARQGSLSWGRVPTTASPSLQITRDGGLSWRVAAATDTEAQFRLRHATSSFAMPIDLRVNAGGADVVVDLDRFATGRVDFSLAFPEVADAVNAALEAAGSNAVPQGEHVGNGDFADWLGVGSGLGEAGILQTDDGFAPVNVAFSPDGNTVFAASSNTLSNRFEAYDTYCRVRRYSIDIPDQIPTALAIDTGGTRALVATAAQTDAIEAVFDESNGEDTANGEDAANGEDTANEGSNGNGIESAALRVRSSLSLIDLRNGKTIGEPIALESVLVTDIAGVPDGSGVYVLLADLPTSDVVRVDWATLERAATGSDVGMIERCRTMPGAATALAVGTDGTVNVVNIVLPATDDSSATVPIGPQRPQGFVTRFPADLGSQPLPPIELASALPWDAAMTTSGRHLVVLSAAEVVMLDAATLRPVATLALPSNGVRLAANPLNDQLLVSTDDALLQLDTSTRKLQPTGITAEAGAGLAISPAGNRAALTVQESMNARLLTIGQDLPAEWELTAGRISPTCFGDPARPVAMLGDPADPKRQAVRPAALSQVVPVAAATPYRFAFHALATIEGATAEVLWRNGDCGADRVDVVPIESLETRPGAVDNLTLHERLFTSPTGAVAAEIRFQTPDDYIELSGVSLAGSSEAVLNTGLATADGSAAGWEVANPLVSLSGGIGGPTVVENRSIDDGQLSQLVAVSGTRFELQLVARLTAGAGAAVVLEFLSPLGDPMADPVRLDMEALAFDCHAAQGEVPAGSVDATLSIAVPAGASMEIDRLSLRFHDPVPVSLGFVAQAPGDLLVSDVSIGTDVAAPHRPPVPDSGLCPATPPGAEPGEDPDCHCPTCGQDTEVRRPVAVSTAAGRPARLSTCQACGEQRLSIGGPMATRAGPPPLRGFALREPASGQVAIGSRMAVARGLEAISGISARRAASLREIGIRSLVDLSNAEVETVASIRGISSAMARNFIDQARTITEHDGRRVLAEPTMQDRGRGPSIVDTFQLLGLHPR